MSNENNTATLAVSNDQYGAVNFWQQGDSISHSVILILLIMSILSWTQIVIKGLKVSKRRKIFGALDQFWEKSSIKEACKYLENEAGQNSSFADVANQAAIATEHFDEQKGQNIGGNLDRGEFITRALRQSINRSHARLESGLTMLASIGAVAPFVGLFGTVYGIYNALLSISSSGNASLNAVAGPVGEALIMTAAGLFVAIPAVLAYNSFVRFNRVELMELDGFAHDLHSYLNSGVKLSKVKRKK